MASDVCQQAPKHAIYLHDLGAFGRTVRTSLRLTLFLSIPAAVGLAALASPIIALIYQHGHFSAHDTAETALALQAYAIGLAGYAALVLGSATRHAC